MDYSIKKSFDESLQSLIKGRFIEILHLDLTTDTCEDLSADDSEKYAQNVQYPVSKLSEYFRAFAEGPLCYDNDRARYLKFTDPASLRAALEKEEQQPAGFVYRRKFAPSDIIYSTVAMKIFPSVTDSGHLTAFLFTRDISDEIQNYNISLDEEVRLQNALPGKRKLLIVEDNEMNREMLAEILSDDYEIFQAENGAVGLELLQKHMMEISAVILDVQMPVMNGYDFLKQAGSDAFLSKIPVIVATGSDNVEEERKCLTLGASDFVGKPYNPGIIRSRIANMIRLRESAATMSILQTDEKTGLYTLQAFYYHAKLTLDRAPDKSYSVTVISADHFNRIGEDYGEETGDRVLRQIADTLHGCMAASDIYGRFGAARFLIFREDQSKEEAETWIQELFRHMNAACQIRGITFKAGIYSHVDRSLSVSMMCDRAITALNSAGQDIKNRYAFYDAKHAEAEKRLAALEQDMWDAYEKGQFSVYYQPKHDARTGKLSGAEALIRWIHPSYGFLSPGEFIPLFEKNGFVTYADYYVLKRTCRNLKKWQQEGLRLVPISVNSSRRDFDTDSYVETVMKPLQENGVDPSLIHIEVTESMFSDRLEEIGRLLSDCREAGFRIELDDFGSGYSSLTTLTILPLDVMKLDMSFMKNYKDEKKRKVLATCITLARNLGLKTVCEGVENEEQLDILRSYGCDLIQGYYFSRPLPEEEFHAYLQKYSD